MKPVNDLTAAEVREHFALDEDRGVLVRIKVVRGNEKFLGKDAGYLNKTGYLALGFKQRPYLAHRLIWLHKYGEWPKAEIDHIDRDKTNNRLENLREATRSQNSHNKICPVSPHTGVRGVRLDKDKKSYRAAIQIKGRRLDLGRHETIEAAAEAYRVHAKAYVGAFIAPESDPG